MMGAVRTSETLVNLCQTTQCNISKPQISPTNGGFDFAQNPIFIRRFIVDILYQSLSKSVQPELSFEICNCDIWFRNWFDSGFFQI
jgi:hypothetical protein